MYLYCHVICELQKAVLELHVCLHQKESESRTWHMLRSTEVMTTVLLANSNNCCILINIKSLFSSLNIYIYIYKYTYIYN